MDRYAVAQSYTYVGMRGRETLVAFSDDSTLFIFVSRI